MRRLHLNFAHAVFVSRATVSLVNVDVFSGHDTAPGGVCIAGAVSDNDKDTAKTEQSELFELSYQMLLSQTEPQAISKSECEAKQRQHRIKSRKQI